MLPKPSAPSKPRTYLVPPDGGWGWFVLAAAMLVNIIISGMIKSFGIFVMEIQETFNLKQAEILWIPAITYFFYSFLGPASSILAIQYSFRFVTIVGGGFVAAGMMLNFFVDSMPALLFLTYGALVGIGAGLAFPATVYIVNSYFWKRRGLANGLCISGSAIGSIILPPLIAALIEEYSFRGASLILGAVTLNIWGAALIYEDVDGHSKKVVLDMPPCDLDIQVVEPVRPVRSAGEEEPCDETVRSFFLLKFCFNGLKELCMTLVLCFQEEKHASNYFPTRHHGVTLTSHKPKQFDEDIRRMSVAKDRWKIVQKYLDFSLFFDPVYLVILISNATSSISYTNFLIFLPSYGIAQGIPNHLAPYLISIFSLFDLVGRMGASILSDYGFVPKSTYFVGGLLISGVALIAVPWATTMLSISCVCAAFGISSGSVIGVTAIVMSDYLGRQKLTSSYGISLFVNGILQLIGPPLCALLLGESENYILLFVLLGLFIILGTSPWALMPCILSRKRRTVTGNETQ